MAELGKRIVRIGVSGCLFKGRLNCTLDNSGLRDQLVRWPPLWLSLSRLCVRGGCCSVSEAGVWFSLEGNEATVVEN